MMYELYKFFKKEVQPANVVEVQEFKREEEEGIEEQRFKNLEKMVEEDEEILIDLQTIA